MYFGNNLNRILDIANGTSLAENPNMWTFKTSWGNFNRLDYVLHSRSLQSSEVSANLDLDMGSDHRNISVSISYIKSKEAWKLRTRSFKGWKPILDESKNADAYHSHLQKLMYDCPPTSLRDLGKIAWRRPNQADHVSKDQKESKDLASHWN